MAKGKAGPPSENPFELRLNKRKHDVLGQKRKGEVGNRGQSRDAAVQLRRRTLQVGAASIHFFFFFFFFFFLYTRSSQVELNQRGKSNAFVDKRIGEYDSTMTPEDRMLARFQKARTKVRARWCLRPAEHVVT